VTNNCGFYIWRLGLLDISITVTLDYNSSHIKLLLDNESLIAFLLFLGLISCLLLLNTTHFSSATIALSESEILYDLRFTANQFVFATSPLRLTTSNSFFQLNTCGYNPYVTFSLMRGWVCRLQLLLPHASAVILRFGSPGTHDHILLSQIRDFLFVASYDSQGYGGGIRPRLNTGFHLLTLALPWVWLQVWALRYNRLSVGLSWNKAPTWGLRPDFYYCQIVAGMLVCWYVGFLWLEDGSVVYNCCWHSPAQSFWGPSPVGLAVIFYRLSFETSLFVASYDSQGHGGRIRPRLHTGFESESESYVTTDGQSASLSWNKAPIWGLRPDSFNCRRTVAGLLIWGALSDERTGLSFTIASGPCQRSHSRVRDPWDSRPYLLSQIWDFFCPS
jgi:hypothetical protein